MSKERIHKFQFRQSIPFFLMHLALLGAFFVHFQWKWIVLCAVLYLVRMFGVTAGYHRYFSHRTYKLDRVSQFIMAWIATLLRYLLTRHYSYFENIRSCLSGRG